MYIKKDILECLNTKESFLLNKKFILDKLIDDPSLFRFASDRLKSDADFVLSILEESLFCDYPIDQKYYCTLLEILPYVNKALKAEINFVRELIRLDPEAILFCDESFRTDKSKVKDLIVEGGIFNYIADHLRKDKELILKAISSDFHGDIIEYVSEKKAWIINCTAHSNNRYIDEKII